MKKEAKKFRKIFGVFLISSMLFGCQQAPKEDELAAQQAAQEAANQQRHLSEVNQNDYRGAYVRAEEIKSSVLKIIDEFNERNHAIESEKPSDFWSSENYQYLLVNLLSDENRSKTAGFNEKESDWDYVVQYTTEQFMDEAGNVKVRDLDIKRLEENSYEFGYSEMISVPYYRYGGQGYSFYTRNKITYDASHDYAQYIRQREAAGLNINDGLFEYARISPNEFVIQTETERLYVKYEEGLYDYDDPAAQTSTDGTEETTDGTEETAETAEPAQQVLHNPLGEKRIVEFYYSKLNGEPRYEYAEIKADENNVGYFSFFDDQSEAAKKGFNDLENDGTYVCVYSAAHDSIFNDIDGEYGANWVFADDGRFKQTISYYDNMMIMKTENDLINKLECINFLADGTTESYSEDIYVPEIVLAKSDEEIFEQLESANEERYKDLTAISTDGFTFGERPSFENQMENQNMEMVDFGGVKYNVMDSRAREYESLKRSVVGTYYPMFQGEMLENRFAIPAGKMFFVSSLDTDPEGNLIPDNENYYTMFHIFEIQDEYTIKEDAYCYVSDNPDCKITLQNIKPRSTTRERVEQMYGPAKEIDEAEILDDEGFVLYTVTIPNDVAAYRCENGIIYVAYDKNDIVETVGMYVFEEPQPTDMIYQEPVVEETVDETTNK